MNQHIFITRKVMSRKLLSLSIAAGVLIPNVVLAEQIVIQRGNRGRNDAAMSNIEQNNVQNKFGNYAVRHNRLAI